MFLTASLTGAFHGAGTYTSGGPVVLIGRAAVGIPTAEGDSVQTYHSTDASPMALTVRADGSGVFTFQRWRTDEMRGTEVAGSLDGTVTWQCR